MSATLNAFQNGETVHFNKGEIFMSPKTPPKGVYLITKGFVISYNQSVSHKKRIQTILKTGDIFPMVWAFNNIQKNISVEAITEGTAKMIEQEIFLNFINNMPEAPMEIVDRLLVMLNTYVDRVDNLEYDTVREKVISRILFFAEKFGVNDGNKIAIDLPITHKLIAESISVSRENVTRELKVLEKDKVIAFKKRQLIVVDIKRLDEELHKRT